MRHLKKIRFKIDVKHMDTYSLHTEFSKFSAACRSMSLYLHVSCSALICLTMSGGKLGLDLPVRKLL